MMPYTAIDDSASTSRIPIGGSASCTVVSWPNHVTVPSWPSLKSPPSGMTDHTRNAGTKARNGASR